MVKITPNNITQEEIIGLLQVLDIHLKLLDKVNPKDVGFIKRQVFIKHKNKVQTLYNNLDNKE